MNGTVEGEQKRGPDERGYFGEFGGRFVPETLMPALEALTLAYRELRALGSPVPQRSPAADAPSLEAAPAVS